MEVIGTPDLDVVSEYFWQYSEVSEHLNCFTPGKECKKVLITRKVAGAINYSNNNNDNNNVAACSSSNREKEKIPHCCAPPCYFWPTPLFYFLSAVFLSSNTELGHPPPQNDVFYTQIIYWLVLFPMNKTLTCLYCDICEMLIHKATQ